MARKMLVLEGLPDNVESVRPKLNLYFKNKRKSGGEAEQILAYPDDNRKALLVYDKQEDLMKVLDKGIHKVDFKERGNVGLAVKLHEENLSIDDKKNKHSPVPHIVKERKIQPGEQEKNSSTKAEPKLKYSRKRRFEGSMNDSSQSDDKNNGEITLLATSSGHISDNILRLYFKQFSDHIDITKHGENKWLLQMMKQSDAEKVLTQKAHDVASTSLTVVMYDEAGAEDRLDPRRFILSGFDSSCKHSLISLYINSCSKGAKHSWEILDNVSKLAVTFREDINVKSFLKECSTNKLEDMEITASRLERTDSILVRGEMRSFTEEILRLYFSSRRSKGGEIISLHWVNKDNSVILTFNDWHAAYRVAEEKHCFSGVTLTVLLFYSNLQKALTGETPSFPTSPGRITLSVDSLLLDSLKGNETFKKQMDRTLQDTHARVCTDNSMEQPSISLEMAVDCESLLMYHVAPGWERKTRNAVQDLLSRYSVIHLAADTDVWDKIGDKCLELSSRDVCIFYDGSRGTILLVGQEREAKCLEETVGPLVKDAAAELVAMRNTVESKIPLNTKKELEFVWNMVSSKLNDVEMSKDEKNLNIHLKGLKDRVSSAEAVVRKAQMNLITQNLNISPHLITFFKSLDLKKFEEDHFAQNCISAVILNCDDACQILAERKDIHKAEDKIMNVFKEEVVKLTPDQVKVTKDENWRNFISGLIKDVSSCVNIPSASIFQNDKMVIVTGFSNVVADVVRKVNGYLNNKMLTTDDVPLKSVQLLELINDCFKLQEVPDIKRLDLTIRTMSYPCLKVTTARDMIGQAVSAVKKQLSLFVLEQHMFSKAGEAQVLKEKANALQTRGKELGCKVYLSLSYSHIIMGSIKLTVVQGDICHQRADALVCPLSNLAFDNPIAQEILKVGGPQLQDACNRLAKEKNTLEAEEVVLFAPGHLSAKTLMYVALPVWGNSSHNAIGQAKESVLLKAAILKCLWNAEAKQSVSMAVPILCSTFNVPLRENCKAIIDAIVEFCESHQGTPKNLQNIFVFDPKIKTVEEFSDIVKDMSTVVKDAKPSVLPANIGSGTPPPTPSKPTAQQRMLIGSTLVMLKKGDITEECVDAIVNATNDTLNLDTGVSGAILKAAGKSVTDECGKLGTQKADGVVVTGGGNLKCKHIIQMVGPTTAVGITTSIQKVLQLCESQTCTSVSIPAIGTGRGHISAKESIGAIIKALEMHTVKNKSCITTVVIVAFEPKVFDAFCEYFAERNQLPLQTKKATILPSPIKDQSGQVHFSTDQASEVKIHGVRLAVKKGNITIETVKGIVNTTNKDLNLKAGVSGAIFEAAGKSVEDECKSLGPQGKDGVVVTSAGSLQCDFIIHMVGPHSAAAVTSQVERVLDQCEMKQITTVSFPAVGAGRGGLKATDVITAMLQGFKNHLSRLASTVLKLAYIVTDQDQVLQDLLQGISHWKTQSMIDSCDKGDKEDEWVTTSEEEEEDESNGTVEVLLGPMKVKLLCGDITKENTDAIVNSTTTSLDLSSGVSGAILKAAGQSVVDECKALGIQPSDGVVITKPGSLQVKHIVHMVGQTKEQSITMSMCKVLKACNDIQVQSVSFPALGTGAGNLAADQVAGAMVQAIRNFLLENSKPSITTIHIVIFQPKMMSSFEEVLKKNKTVTPRKAKISQSSNIRYLDLSSLVDTLSYPTMAVEVCGTSTASLAQMKKYLEDLIAEKCTSKDVDDQHLHLLQSTEKQVIASFCHKHNLQLAVHPDRLTVSGEKDSVYQAVLNVKDLIQKAKDRESQKHDEERIRRTVQWQRAKFEKWSAMNSNLNYNLEMAYLKKKKTYVYTLHGETFTVDLEQMQEMDSKGNAFRIRRTPLLQDSEMAVIQMPPHWNKMDGKDQIIVPLLPTSDEFQKISKEFVQSCQEFTQKKNKKIEVIQIDRIQNEEQWQRYTVRKKALDRKYPKSKNEQILYHGTTKEICKKINTNGFNRSFSGRNATKYGYGTYFAREAYYSCYDTYSSPDKSGQKYIYMARVLTGKVCLAHGDMKEPDPLNPNDPSAGLHDCAVDSVNNPFIFVIFCDSGAYPEYLVTFKSV